MNVSEDLMISLVVDSQACTRHRAESCRYLADVKKNNEA